VVVPASALTSGVSTATSSGSSVGSAAPYSGPTVEIAEYMGNNRYRVSLSNYKGFSVGGNAGRRTVVEGGVVSGGDFDLVDDTHSDFATYQITDNGRVETPRGKFDGHDSGDPESGNFEVDLTRLKDGPHNIAFEFCNAKGACDTGSVKVYTAGSVTRPMVDILRDGDKPELKWIGSPSPASKEILIYDLNTRKLNPNTGSRITDDIGVKQIMLEIQSPGEEPVTYGPYATGRFATSYNVDNIHELHRGIEVTRGTSWTVTATDFSDNQETRSGIASGPTTTIIPRRKILGIKIGKKQ
jgi:hypothetical protein